MMATSPGRLWLIVPSGEARLWRETPGGAMHGAFEPVELLVSGADEGCA
jgi:desampylase